MKRIIIICEGETEQEFCKDVLYPYFQKKNIFIEYPKIKKSNGGIVSWASLKRQIEIHLRQNTKVRVTTFIDYYGILKKHHFPKWEESQNIKDKSKRMDFLESNMKNDLDSNLRFRFIPYLQLHEFEGLLFNNIKVFKEQIPTKELVDINELEQIIKKYPNPELINDKKETAPSTRLERLITGYKKIVYGSILAEAIGLERIVAKSPRFRNWLSKLSSDL
jgi:hypothetical protein